MIVPNRYDTDTERETYENDRFDRYSVDRDRINGSRDDRYNERSFGDRFDSRYSSRFDLNSDPLGDRSQDRDQDRYAGRSDRFDRFDRFDSDRFIDSHYESEKLRTSATDRDRLMSSLERRTSKTRLERSDDRRYHCYVENAEVADNNFDRMWDKRHSDTEYKQKKVFNGKRLPFIVAYFVIAIVAVIAVTLSLTDHGGRSVKTTKLVSTGNPISANAENPETEDVSAAEEQPEKTGGETFILLNNGEIVEIEIPEIAQKTEEKEKGFDKFCTWLNERIGG